LESLHADADGLRKEIEQGNIEKLSNENEILNLRQRQKLLAEEATVLNSEIAEIDETVRGYDERRNTIDSELNEANRRREELQTEIASAGKSLAEQQAAAAQVREEITRLKVALADKEARRGGLERSIMTSQATLEDIETRLAATEHRMRELKQRQAEAEATIASASEEIERLEGNSKALQAEMQQLEASLQRARAHRTECLEQTRSVRAAQEETRAKLHQEQVEEQKLRVRMESLSEHVFSEYGIRLEEFAEDPAMLVLQAQKATRRQGDEQDEPVTTPDWDAVSEQISELREKIRRLGGVNIESIDEEEGLEIAIAETEGHREDLVQAEAHLREVIRKLNRVCRERFTKTFEEVRENFHETFRRLFGGCRADLVIDEEEPDMLEAGIDVLACPPGKELRSITLLSGGEKTMTTIALLFAIFKSKPSPFCILDEVDAALDEANIDRFTGMLTEFLKDSQFIIITHSKRTIGIANVLYGITMQEKGVSKLVAVSLEGTEAMNN